MGRPNTSIGSMPSDTDRNSARGRLDRMGVIFFGDRDPELVVERVLADYALVGKTPIDVLKKRAQERVRRLDAANGGDGKSGQRQPGGED